jgi:hypothetical protein
MGVIIRGVKTPWSAGENFRCTLEHLQAPATGLGALAICLRAPATSLEAPRITVEQSGQNFNFFGNATGAHGNHSYYISFNDL